MLLQMLEDGYLTDAKGRRVDFTNTIVIMTSNIGAEQLQKRPALALALAAFLTLGRSWMNCTRSTSTAFATSKNSACRKLLNRIDKVIVFRA